MNVTGARIIYSPLSYLPNSGVNVLVIPSVVTVTAPPFLAGEENQYHRRHHYLYH